MWGEWGVGGGGEDGKLDRPGQSNARGIKDQQP